MPPEPNKCNVVKVCASDHPDPHCQSATNTIEVLNFVLVVRNAANAGERIGVNLYSFLLVMETSCRDSYKATRIRAVMAVLVKLGPGMFMESYWSSYTRKGSGYLLVASILLITWFDETRRCAAAYSD
jgi:hypothetical protein